MGYLQNAYNSGTFTCNVFAFSGAITNVTIISASYMQINNIITCYILGNIDLDFSTINIGTCTFLGLNGQITNGGNGSFNINIPNVCNGVMVGGQLELYSNDITLIVSSKSFTTIFTYQI